MDHVIFEIKAESIDAAAGTFSGMGAVFGNVDAFGDVIEPGAFTRTIKSHKGKIVILNQHNSDEPIGMAEMKETPKGLHIDVALNMDLDLAKDVMSNIAKKILKGLSIGFETIKRDFIDGVRKLKELKLWEVSVVTFPANPKALIGAKGALPFMDLAIAQMSHPWDAEAALKRVKGWAGVAGDTMDEDTQAKFMQAFAISDPEAKDSPNGYRLQIADVIDGRLHAVPRGVFAAAAKINIRGFDGEETDRARAHLGRYYLKTGLTPPWESKSLMEPALIEATGWLSVAKDQGVNVDATILEGLAVSVIGLLHDSAPLDALLTAADFAAGEQKGEVTAETCVLLDQLMLKLKALRDRAAAETDPSDNGHSDDAADRSAALAELKAAAENFEKSVQSTAAPAT